jgi:hypothetical protein
MKREKLPTPAYLRAVAVCMASVIALNGAGLAPVRDNSMLALARPALDPIPTYSLTWTMVANGLLDTTDELGTRTVFRNRIAMVLYGTYRQYSSGDYDYVPYTVTYTDDEDSLTTGECPDGTSETTHITVKVTDPQRYIGSPTFNLGPGISREQNQDGSWLMHGPDLAGNVGTYQYHHLYSEDIVSCFGNSHSENTFESLNHFASLVAPLQALPYVSDAAGKVFSKDAVYTVDDIYTVEAHLTIRVLAGRDLTVDRLEVTQALQDEANSMPLVEGRRTVVRAYIGIGQDPSPVPFVGGLLRGYSGLTLLGSVGPFNGPITAKADPDWHQINDTLNFELPSAWTLHPELRLEVEVNPNHSVAESDFTNNRRDATLPFHGCGSVRIAYLPIHYTAPLVVSPPYPSTNIGGGAEFLRKVYPVASYGLDYFPFPNQEFTLATNINLAGAPEALSQVLGELLLSGALGGHVYGWLPEHAYLNGGAAEEPGVVAFGNDTEPDYWRVIMAHEVGHNYGLAQADPALTTGGMHWFDVFERVIKPVPGSLGGTELRDMMAGGTEAELWISPQNYERLLEQICSGGSTARNAKTQAPTAVNGLLVTGIYSPTNPAASTLSPVFHLTSAPTSTLPVGTQACVNLKDIGGTLLSQYCFDPGFAAAAGAVAPGSPFGMVVPDPAGLHRVDLVRGNTVLDSRVASLNVPTVTLTFPNAAGLTLSNTQNVTWTGGDLDGDPLTYAVLYSNDNGATWVGIGAGITQTSYPVTFAGLAGTTIGSGRIRVLVSDGFNTAADSSDNAFTIANKPPSAVIISPPTGAAFTMGPKVVLQGAGLDLENGALDGSALSWSSSRDGALGSGPLREVDLSLGVHTLTLMVTDTGGLTRTATAQITVVAPIGPKQLFLPAVVR